MLVSGKIKEIEFLEIDLLFYKDILIMELSSVDVYKEF